MKTRVVDREIWYGHSYAWYRIDPSVAPWQLREAVPSGQPVMAISEKGDYLSSSSTASIVWVEDGESRPDINGQLRIYAHLYLDDGDFLLHTDGGLVQRSATSVRQVLDSSQIPLATRWDMRAGCGASQDDYYLVARTALYHCVRDQAILRGTWEPGLSFNSVGLSATGEVYAGEGDGLYHWQGSSWQKVLPLPESQEQGFKVWSLGDGRLGAIDTNGQCYFLEGDLWVSMGKQRWRTIVLAGDDGTLFSLQELSGSENFPGGNGLSIYDATAGAFRAPQQRGMGALANLDIVGGTSQAGEVLIWTRAPSMVFTLRGAPAQGDWRVVAGPLDLNIVAVDRMPDGCLLARTSNDEEFSIYRP